jgi:hypothetical protein
MAWLSCVCCWLGAQVPTKVGVGIRMVPNKVAYGIKALADAEEDKSLIVGDVLPKPATE